MPFLFFGPLLPLFPIVGREVIFVVVFMIALV